MPVTRIEVPSTVLDTSTRISAVLPEEPSEPPAVLYLLHGLGEDDGAWLRRSSIAERVAGRAVAVVMPSIGSSFGTDEAEGLPYGRFLVHELPGLVGRHLGVTAPRERTFVAGASMGGYAALRWALHAPERFAAAASLSGSLDIADPDRYRRRPELMRRLFGGRPVPGTPDDLLALVARAVGPQPRLHVACGADDAHLAENRRFVAAARAADRSVTLDVGPGGHDWAYWDGTMGRILAAWFPRT